MAIRVLDILNYSNQRNPQADSGVQLKKELISAIIQKRDDYFFYIFVPAELFEALKPEFDCRNVLLIPTNLISRQQGGAFHFDVSELSSVLDLRQMDFDLLFVNQPELTAPLLDFFNKVHFFDIHSFGYIHWMDWKKQNRLKNRWNQPANLSVLTSILLSAVTGCNSRYGKQQILKEAAQWLNPQALKLIDEKLIPLHPGVNCREIMREKTTERFPEKTIIFPFRTQKYTGFKSLIEVYLANLWEKRRDFRLLLTNPSDYDYVKNYPRRFPFVEVCHFNRKDYLNALWKADIVVGCHNGSNQWSLAAVEAVTAECIPLFNKSSFFPEMISEAAPQFEEQSDLQRYLYYRAAFTSKLEALLDNLDEEKKRVKSLSQKFRRFYDWENRVDDWIRCMDIADAAAPEISERSETIGRIEDFVRRNGKCSKKEILEYLKWHPKSRHISWTKYRKYLRRQCAEEPYESAVVFTGERKKIPDNRQYMKFSEPYSIIQ